MIMDPIAVLGVLIAVVVGAYLLRAISRPVAQLGKVALRSAVALFAIWVVNVLGGFVGFHIGLNLVTGLTVGFLGLPGAALIVAAKYLL